MNVTRSSGRKASGMIMGALGLSLLAACSAAPDAQGENVNTAKEALCGDPDGCTTTGGTGTKYIPFSRIGATCPGTYAGCGVTTGTWSTTDTFEVNLKSAGCTLLKVENNTNGSWQRTAVCAQGATLDSIVAPASQYPNYCDDCLGAPVAGYAYVFWGLGSHDPMCGGCVKSPTAT